MIIGLVGLPSSGKSTFFKACTLVNVAIAPYPFTTIKKNEGIAFVKVNCVDKEFNVKCQPKYGYCLNNNRFVPIQLIDVAGLVPEAHLGKGRGNEFLSDLNQADALIQIIDVSGSINENGEQVEVNSYDISNYVKILETELDMWYYGIIKKGWERFVRQVKQENSELHKALAKQLSGLRVSEEVAKEVVNSLNKEINNYDNNDLKKLASELRKKTKPMVIAANKIDVKDAKKNLEKLNEFSYEIFPCSAESELALKEAAKHGLIEYIPGENNFKVIGNLNDNQKNALNFIKENILDKFKGTGVQDILNYVVFNLLKNIAVYPVANSKLSDKDGNILPDCFLIPENTTALDFAFKVHSDFGENFIKAIDLKTKRVIGKDSKLNNIDVIEIMVKK